MIICSGACNSYYYSLRQLINNLVGMGKGNHFFYIFNLGLHPKRWEFLKSRPNVKNDQRFVWVEMPWDKFAPHYRDLQTYAFKSACLKYIRDHINGQVVMWMDSACLLEARATEIEEMVRRYKVYSPYSAADIEKWCHPTTIERMGYCGSINHSMRSGGLFAVDLSSPVGIAFLENYHRIMAYENIVCPLGSNKSNHRQDQSVLTILYWQFADNKDFPVVDEWIGLSFHNNIFPNE